MIEFDISGLEVGFRAHHVNLEALRADATRWELGRVEIAKRSGGKLREPQVVEAIIQRNVNKHVGVGEKHNSQEDEYRQLSRRQKEIYAPLNALEELYRTEYTVKPEGSKKELSKLRKEDRQVLERKKKLSGELDKSNSGIIGSQKMPNHIPGTEEMAKR